MSSRTPAREARHDLGQWPLPVRELRFPQWHSLGRMGCHCWQHSHSGGHAGGKLCYDFVQDAEETSILLRSPEWNLNVKSVCYVICQTRVILSLVFEIFLYLKMEASYSVFLSEDLRKPRIINEDIVYRSILTWCKESVVNYTQSFTTVQYLRLWIKSRHKE